MSTHFCRLHILERGLVWVTLQTDICLSKAYRSKCCSNVSCCHDLILVNLINQYSENHTSIDMVRSPPINKKITYSISPRHITNSLSICHYYVLSLQRIQLFGSCSIIHWPGRETFVTPSKRKLSIPQQRLCSAGRHLPEWVFDQVNSKFELPFKHHFLTCRETSESCNSRRAMSKVTPLYPELEDPLLQDSHRLLVPISL